MDGIEAFEMASAGAAGAATVQAGTDTASAVGSTTSSFFDKLGTTLTTIFTNPLIAIPLILILAFSLLWFPFHPLGLQVVQIIHTDIVRPFSRDIAVPVFKALAPVYETFAEWWNFFNFLIRHYIVDLVLLPLRCDGTATFIRTAINTITPTARALNLGVSIVGDTVRGKSSPPLKVELFVGLLMDAGANFTDALGGLLGCYCSISTYYIDLVAMSLANHDLQCTVSNVIGWGKDSF